MSKRKQLETEGVAPEPSMAILVGRTDEGGLMVETHEYFPPGRGVVHRSELAKYMGWGVDGHRKSAEDEPGVRVQLPSGKVAVLDVATWHDGCAVELPIKVPAREGFVVSATVSPLEDGPGGGDDD